MPGHMDSADPGDAGRAVRARLAEKCTKSREIGERSAELMNMGSAASLEMPHPVLIERGEGPYLFDVDGNRYIDCQVGFGSMILGHRHKVVQDAIIEQVTNRGWQFGIHSPQQVPLAELVTSASCCMERVIFCNSGSEATMYAIRAARAFTAKMKIGVFDGFYHGMHDYGFGLALPDSPRDAPEHIPLGAGVLPEVHANRIMLPRLHEAAFDMIRKHADELAVVMIEPVQSSNPRIDAECQEFLRALQKVCRENNVLFLMDEVITGFRLRFGGAQEYVGLQPDLVTYGKVIGGGMPVGAVAGRSDIMRLFSSFYQGDMRGVFSGGTFSGNPNTMAAGAAQLGWLSDNRDTVYPYLQEQVTRLAERVNGFASLKGMGVQMLNALSMFQIFFTPTPIKTGRDVYLERPAAEMEFYLHLLDRGVLIPGTRRSFISVVHTPELVDEIGDAIIDSLEAVRSDGLI